MCSPSSKHDGAAQADTGTEVRLRSETDRQAGRQSDRQTGRQADRQTGRQAGRQTGRSRGSYLFQDADGVPAALQPGGEAGRGGGVVVLGGLGQELTH